MSKAIYNVNVIHKGMESEYHALCKAGSWSGGQGGEVSFIEPVRASNRREAFVLARRKYPDHLVLDDAVKKPASTEAAPPKDRPALPSARPRWRPVDA